MNATTDRPESRLTAAELASLGMNQVAYVRQIRTENETRYEVHTADGTAVHVLPTAELAETLIRQNDLVPLSLH